MPCGDVPVVRPRTPPALRARMGAAAADADRRRRALLTGTLSLGTFATHVVVHAAQAVPLPAGLDPVAACLLGLRRVDRASARP